MNSTLSENVLTILENSRIQPSDNYIYTDKTIDTTNSVICDPSKFGFSNKQVIALKSYYFQQNVDSRKEFISILTSKIEHKIINNNLISIASNVLIHIGEFDRIMDTVDSWVLSDFNKVCLNSMLALISQTIKYEWNIYKPKQIETLTKWVNATHNNENKIGKEILYNWNKDVKSTIDKLYIQLNILNTNRITDEIYAKYNPEINEDKLKLVEQLNRYDFPTDLAETLDKIDQKMISATDTFDYKGCMDLIRNFTERLYQSIAISLDSVEGQSLDNTDSEKVAKFFMKTKLVSEGQAKLLTSIQHFLSNSAAHKLKSRPEDARLSKNMVIEFSLYLMRRLKDIRNQS
ncbi:MAG: hypothetical protein WC069_04090 [Candidatus Shapirobacteria bacterium]